MTKAEVIAELKAIGVNVYGLKDEALEKIGAWLDEQKAQLDTETRRKVRAFWIVCTAFGMAAASFAGWFLRGFMG